MGQPRFPSFDATNGNVASRAASGVVLNAFAPRMPELVGGSADLAGSTLTTVKGAPFVAAATPGGRNVHFGIREHAMGAMMNGMALHGGVIPYGGTFLMFSDYMRPAIRLAALMKRQVIYVFTHDSIGLGEDGPTHQPIEQLSALRCIPNLLVIRPADANETAEAWKVAIKHRTGPTALVLTRQKLPLIDRAKSGAASGARARRVRARRLRERPAACRHPGVGLRSRDRAQGARAAGGGARGRARRQHALPRTLRAAVRGVSRRAFSRSTVRRVAIEAAHPMSWYRWVGADGVIVGIDHFGASRPVPEALRGIRAHGGAPGGDRPHADRPRLIACVQLHAFQARLGQALSSSPACRASQRRKPPRGDGHHHERRDAAEHHARHRAEQLRRHAGFERTDLVRRADEDRVDARTRARACASATGAG